MAKEKTSTTTGRSYQVSVRIPFDVLSWIEGKTTSVRKTATVINELLRTAHIAETSPRKTKRKRSIDQAV